MAERRLCTHGPQSFHPGCRHDPNGQEAKVTMGSARGVPPEANPPVSPRRKGTQPRLPGFPPPEGMIAAREALNATQRPLYGPQRPPGDYSMLQRRQFGSEAS